jgi:hypothetical protein
LTGCPSIDNAQCLVNLIIDQRGLPRPAGEACDISAVERQPGDTGVFIYLPVIFR